MAEIVELVTSRTAYLVDARARLYSDCVREAVFDSLIPEHVYVAWQAAEFRDCLKRILADAHKNIVLCGSEESLGLLLNTFRELVPNPSRRIPIALVMLGQSTRFVQKYGLEIAHEHLGRLGTMRFVLRRMKFLELDGVLAPYVRAGIDWRALTNLEKLKLSFKASQFGSLIPQNLATSYASLCINESPQAYRVERRLLLSAIEQEQVLFSGHVFSVFAAPVLLESSAQGRGQEDMFELTCNMRPSLQWGYKPLRIESQHFLCQRVRMEFSPEIPVHMPGFDSTASRQVLLTLSQRDFSFLAPMVPGRLE